MKSSGAGQDPKGVKDSPADAVAGRVDGAAPCVPPARPYAPQADALLPYLQELDRSRIYSNFGPLSKDLARRIARMARVPEPCAVTAANGTAALTAALTVRTRGRSGPCLMPSWTFLATPAAALFAGLTPHFLDVDPGTWALCPSRTAERAMALQASAVVVVAPFGTPLDWPAWADMEARTGIPVVIDAAAAFDTVTAAPSVLGPAPVIVSLHATKALGCGEGGVVLTGDVELADGIYRVLNFGLTAHRQAGVIGFNGKLSEYHAAVAHAALDGWAERRRDWLAVKARLGEALGMGDAGGSGARCVPGPDARLPVAVSTYNILCPGPADALALRLSAQGVMTLRWWGGGCAVQPAFAHLPADPLPVTDALAQRALGLPCFPDLSDAHARRVARALGQALGTDPVVGLGAAG